jgi:sporulation protein YlmC with PRC-barrel domain
MKAKDLIGRQVIDADARVVGRIVDVDLDISSASINNLILKSSWTKRHKIPPQDIEKVGDKIILKITKDKVQKA